jgi:tetratricopeptide (TPR) repeat protein
MASQNDRPPNDRADAGPGSPNVPRAVFWLVGISLGLVMLLALGRWLGPARPQAAALPEPSQGRQAQPVSPHSGVAISGAAAGSLGAGSALNGAQAATLTSPTEEIREVTRRLRADFPNRLEALQISADADLAFGQTAKAAEYWRQCLALDPNCAPAYFGLATVAASKGDRAEAERLLRKVLSLVPDSLEAQFGLGQLLFDRRQIPAAIDVLRKLVESHPGFARGFTMLGAAYLESNALEEARRAYQSAIKLDSQDWYPCLGMANVCARAGQAQEAKQYRTKFRQLQAGRRESVHGMRERYDDAGSMGSLLARVCTSAARLYRAQGDLAEVERLCRRAAEAAPQQVESRQVLARLYRQSGRTAEAIRTLEELARIQPSAVGYPLEIARIYAELGQKDKADQWRGRARDVK